MADSPRSSRPLAGSPLARSLAGSPLARSLASAPLARLSSGRRLARRALVVGLALAALAAPACLGSTGNERFRFEARIAGAERDASVPFTFTNTFDWTVTLAHAAATVGPIYLNTVRPTSVSPTGRLWSWLVTDAWASDSHLGEGLIVGEVLGQQRVDLLSPALVPFSVVGSITGDQIRSAEIFYYPPPGVAPEVTEPTDPVTGAILAAVEVDGAAERAGQVVRFRGRLVLDSTWQPGGTPGSLDFTPITEIRQVRGIPASFVADEGGHLEIRIDAAGLFRNANFAQLGDDSLTDPDDPGLYVLPQESQVMKSLYNELKSSTGTYSVRWVPRPDTGG